METAVLVAVIAMVAAILGPVISACVTSYFTYRTKKFELFFGAKSAAYQDFLSFASQHPLGFSPGVGCDSEDIVELYHLAANALLYSSGTTQSKISCYCDALLHSDYSKCAHAQQDAILAMQDDLRTTRRSRLHSK